jgi:hypothetical protein
MGGSSEGRSPKKEINGRRERFFCHILSHCFLDATFSFETKKKGTFLVLKKNPWLSFLLKFNLIIGISKIIAALLVESRGVTQNWASLSNFS